MVVDAFKVFENDMTRKLLLCTLLILHLFDVLKNNLGHRVAWILFKQVH